MVNLDIQKGTRMATITAPEAIESGEDEAFIEVESRRLKKYRRGAASGGSEAAMA